MQTKFHTKSGWLTQYALDCGYMETNAYWHEERLASLWKESGVYHVAAYDINKGRVYWGSYAKYADAKKDFIVQLKARKAKRFVNKG